MFFSVLLSEFGLAFSLIPYSTSAWTITKVNKVMLTWSSLMKEWIDKIVNLNGLL